MKKKCEKGKKGMSLLYVSVMLGIAFFRLLVTDRQFRVYLLIFSIGAGLLTLEDLQRK